MAKILRKGGRSLLYLYHFSVSFNCWNGYSKKKGRHVSLELREKRDLLSAYYVRVGWLWI